MRIFGFSLPLFEAIETVPGSFTTNQSIASVIGSGNPSGLSLTGRVDVKQGLGIFWVVSFLNHALIRSFLLSLLTNERSITLKLKWQGFNGI